MFAIFELYNARKAIGPQWDRGNGTSWLCYRCFRGEWANIISLGYEFGVFMAYDFSRPQLAQPPSWILYTTGMKRARYCAERHPHTVHQKAFTDQGIAIGYQWNMVTGLNLLSSPSCASPAIPDFKQFSLSQIALCPKSPVHK